MKILHLPSSFFPSHAGGKEVFVYQLIKNSSRIGTTHLVVIHDGEESKHYTYKDVLVQVLPKVVAVDNRGAYFSGMYDELPGFEDVLTSFMPDIVHFHDQGKGASLAHLLICKNKGIKTLLTYHSPGQSCLQRALMFAGERPCDGRIDFARCSSCRYQSMGVPAFIANVVGRIQLPIDKTGLWIQRNRVELFYGSWRKFYAVVDGIQVHAKWVQELLLLNGVGPKKVHYVEMGGSESMNRGDWMRTSAEGPLKLVYVGRCTDIKGTHLLIEAVQQLPIEINVEVHFWGPGWDTTAYGLQLQRRVQGDNRFKAPRFIEPNQVTTELLKMDIAVIPSLWPETGPFTVFDAFAAGLPIIGTLYAGIAERVKDGENGLLFNWGNVTGLETAIRTLATNRSLVNRLQENIAVNRTFEQMAEDMVVVYRKIVGGNQFE